MSNENINTIYVTIGEIQMGQYRHFSLITAMCNHLEKLSALLCDFILQLWSCHLLTALLLPSLECSQQMCMLPRDDYGPIHVLRTHALRVTDLRDFLCRCVWGGGLD